MSEERKEQDGSETARQPAGGDSEPEWEGQGWTQSLQYGDWVWWTRHSKYPHRPPETRRAPVESMDDEEKRRLGKMIAVLFNDLVRSK